MVESNSKAPAKKKNYALRKLIGTVVIAGAAYAAEKLIESRKKKRESKKENNRGN